MDDVDKVAEIWENAGFLPYGHVDNPVETVDERLFAQLQAAEGLGADMHCIGA